MFCLLMMWGLLLAGDPQTPEQHFNLGVAAEEKEDYPTAIFQFTEAIGAVTDAENLTYAVMSMRHLKKIYPKVSFVSPWPEITKKTAKALIKQKELERPEKMDKEAIDVAYVEHPYFQALAATNLLIREAGTNPQLADQYLLMAYFLKKDYPITFLALSRNAKRKGDYFLARRFLIAFKMKVQGPTLLPELVAYSDELKALLHVPPEEATTAPEIDLKALKNRMKAEPSAAHFFDYASALAADPAEKAEMIRYLQKAHDLEPANVAILTALAKTVPDQKKDHELLPELMEAYRQDPQRGNLLFQAIRLAGRDKKAGLTRQLLTEHPEDAGGYQMLDLLAPAEVNPLLVEIPWLAQGKAIRDLVYAHLERRKDPAAALDLFRELYRRQPSQLEVLENLVRYSAQSPAPEREQWLEAYRDNVSRRVRETLADTDFYSAQDYLFTANDLLDDKSIKVQCYFLRELNHYKFKIDELSALVEAFPDSAYLHERFGDLLAEKDKLKKAKKQYKLALEQDGDRPGVEEKLERVKDAQAAKWLGGLFAGFGIQLGGPAFSLRIGVPIMGGKNSPIFIEGPTTLSGLTHLGLDPAIIAPIASQHALICDNPAVEVLELLESEP